MEDFLKKQKLYKLYKFMRKIKTKNRNNIEQTYQMDTIKKLKRDKKSLG